jgi:hypothetical protein
MALWYHSTLYRVKANTTTLRQRRLQLERQTTTVDKPDCKTSRRKKGVDKNHAYLSLPIRFLYLPQPSMTQVTVDVTVHKLKSQIAG